MVGLAEAHSRVIAARRRMGHIETRPVVRMATRAPELPTLPAIEQKTMPRSRVYCGYDHRGQWSGFPNRNQTPDELMAADYSRNICSVENIIFSVSGKFGFTVRQMKYGGRDARLVAARHALFYLCRKYTPLSLPRIGEMLGGFDHTTVLHGFKKVSDIVTNEDTEYAQSVRDLERVLSVTQSTCYWGA